MGQEDERSEDAEMPVIFSNYGGSLVRYTELDRCRSVPSACDEKTVAADAYLVMDNISEVQVGGTVKGEHVKEENGGVRWAPETDIEVEEVCLSDESSSVEEQSSGQIQETDSSIPSLHQLQVSGSEDEVHMHLESGTLNSIEAFNTFQYWRVPIVELEFDFSLAEAGKPTAVRTEAKVTNEASQRTSLSELNVIMDIDVSSFELVLYLLGIS
jgi:hypothetical protein